MMKQKLGLKDKVSISLNGQHIRGQQIKEQQSKQSDPYPFDQVKPEDKHKWMFGWAPQNTRGFFNFGMAQRQIVPLVLNMHLHRHPNITAIIEFGTGCGALTLLFGLSMLQRKGRVVTFDTGRPWETWFKAKYSLPIMYRQQDVFSKEVQAKIPEYLKGSEQALFFCDNGNKPKEVQTYAPMMRKGDLMLVHDWHTEINEKDIQDLLDRGIIEYYNQQFFDDNMTMLVSLRKK